jgi:hypothetical protein
MILGLFTGLLLTTRIRAGWGVAQRKLRPGEHPRGAPIACAFCGELFAPLLGRSRPAKYCGGRCKTKGWRAANPSNMARIRAAGADAEKRSRREKGVKCPGCLTLFCPLGGVRSFRYCSPGCSGQPDLEGQRLRYRVRHRATKSKPVNCSVCGAWFSRLQRGAGALCSVSCAKVAKAARCRIACAARRKLLARAEMIDPFAVFERDGWACVYCGVPTPRDLRGSTRPTAPELDHVTPVSKGGSHTWGNLVCACRKCNAEKSDSPAMIAWPGVWQDETTDLAVVLASVERTQRPSYAAWVRRT